MVNDAEKFKAEDDAIRAKVDAKNGLESYCFQIKNTLNEPQLRDKLTEEDKATITAVSDEGLQWLAANGEADAEAMNAKQKEIEAKFNPIMQRVYQAAGPEQDAPGADGGVPTDADDLD